MDMEDYGDYFLHKGRIKIWKQRMLELPHSVVGPVVQSLLDFGENVTNYDQFHFRTSLKPYVALWILVYALIFAFGIILNYKLIKWIKRRGRRMCKAHAFIFRLFMGNAVNDLFIKDLIVLPVAFIMMTGVHWVLGRLPCKLFPIVQDSCFYSSNLILLCSFYSRYKHIAHSSFNSCTHVIEYQESLKSASSIPFLLGCFVIAHIAIIPHTIYIEFVDFAYYFGPGFAGTGVCTPVIENHIIDYVKYLFILFYVIPVVLSLSYYFKTVDIIDKWIVSAEDFVKTKRINIHRGSAVETSSFLNSVDPLPHEGRRRESSDSRRNSASGQTEKDLQRTDSKRRRVDFHPNLTINPPSPSPSGLACDNEASNSSHKQHPFETHRSSIRLAKKENCSRRGSKGRRRRRTLAAINEEVGLRSRNHPLTSSVRVTRDINRMRQVDATRMSLSQPIEEEGFDPMVEQNFPRRMSTTGRVLPSPRRTSVLQPSLGHQMSDGKQTSNESASRHYLETASMKRPQVDDVDGDESGEDDEDDDGYSEEEDEDGGSELDYNGDVERGNGRESHSPGRDLNANSGDKKDGDSQLSQAILLRSNLDLEQLIQKLMSRILIFHSCLLLPFNILRFVRHLVPESRDLTYIYDVLFLTLVALQLSTVLLIPTLVLSFFVPEYQKILKSLQEEEQRKEELNRLRVAKVLSTPKPPRLDACQTSSGEQLHQQRKGSKDSSRSVRSSSIPLTGEQSNIGITITNEDNFSNRLQVTSQGRFPSSEGNSPSSFTGSQTTLRLGDDVSALQSDLLNPSLKRSLSARVTSGDSMAIRRSLRDKRTSLAVASSQAASLTPTATNAQQQLHRQQNPLSLDTNHLQALTTSRHSLSTSPLTPVRTPTTPFTFQYQQQQSQQQQQQHRHHHQLPPIPSQGMMPYEDIHSTIPPFTRQTSQRRSLYQQPQQPIMSRGSTHVTNLSPHQISEYPTEVHQGLHGGPTLTTLARPRSSSCFVGPDYRQTQNF